MSDNRRFNVPPGDDFSDTPPAEIIQTEYVTPEEAALEDYKELQVDYSQSVDKPPAVISINDKPLAVLGEFSFIYGKAKSKKTFLTAMIVAGALNNRWSVFQGHLTEERPKVLIFDTEQSLYYVNRLGKNITRLIGHTGLHENLTIYKLRGRPPEEMRKIVETVTANTPDVGLVIIDGIRDLLRDINSQEEASITSEFLTRLTDTYPLHIVTVLHENKKDKNPRGAIGTELVNKCGTAINVERESKTVSKVEVTDGRDITPDTFGFTVNERGLPEVIDGWKEVIHTPGKKKLINADELNPHETFELLKRLEKNVGEKQLKYQEVCDAMAVAYRQKMKEEITKSRAKSFVNYYKTTGNLVVVGTEGTRHSWYKVKPPESPAKRKEPDPQTHIEIDSSMHDQSAF